MRLTGLFDSILDHGIFMKIVTKRSIEGWFHHRIRHVLALGFKIPELLLHDFVLAHHRILRDHKFRANNVHRLELFAGLLVEISFDFWKHEHHPCIKRLLLKQRHFHVGVLTDFEGSSPRLCDRYGELHVNRMLFEHTDWRNGQAAQVCEQRTHHIIH